VLNAHFLFLMSWRNTGEVALNDECCVFITIDLRINNEYIRKSRVGNPLLFTVQNIMGSCFIERCCCFSAQGVRPRTWLGQRIGGNHLTGSQFWQIFFFLFLIAKKYDWQRSDADMPTVSY